MQATGSPNNVSDYRKARRLTQQELAAEIGVHRVHLARIEGGLDPSRALAQRLADFFHTTIAALFPNEAPASPLSRIPEAALSSDDRLRVEEALRQRKSVLVTGWDLPYIGNVLCALADFVAGDNDRIRDVAFIDTTHSLPLPESIREIPHDLVSANAAPVDRTLEPRIPIQRELVHVALKANYHAIALHDLHFELATFPSLVGVQMLASMRASTPHQALAALAHGMLFATIQNDNAAVFDGHFKADDYASVKQTVESAFDLIVHHAWNRIWLMTPQDLFVPGATPWTALSLA